MFHGPRPTSVSTHTWVITYDISDSRRRTKLAKMLGGYGERIQFSVFECRVNEHEIEALRQRVLALLDPEVDRIRWYPLCRPCLDRIVVQGEGLIPEDEDGYYIA